MYVSQVAITTNAHQARISLSRLINVARAYTARVPLPGFGDTPPDPTLPRKEAMDAGARVQEADAVGVRARGDARVGYGHLYRAQSASGWWVQ